MPDIIINADASASLDYEPPVSGLAYLNFFRRPSDLSRNLVGIAATVVGAPVASAGYVITDGGSDYIDTGLTDDDPGISLVVLARAAEIPASTSAAQLFIGNYLGNSEAGMGANIYVSGTGDKPVVGSYWEGGSRTRNITGGRIATDWAIRALRISETEAVVEDVTAGVRLPFPMTATRSLTNRTTVRVGWGGASFGGLSHIASAAIARRFLSDTELADLAQAMRAMASMDGITA